MKQTINAAKQLFVLIAFASLPMFARAYEQDFVYREGKQLMLNGEPFHIAGMNAQQSLSHFNYGVQDSSIEHAVFYGVNVLRIWGSSEIGSVDDDSVITVGQAISFDDLGSARPYYQYWDVNTQSVAYNEGENGLQFLDRFIAMAGENDIHIIFNLADNWEWWWGSINQYVIWHGGTSHGDFFTNEDIKQTYKNWVSYLLNRTCFDYRASCDQHVFDQTVGEDGEVRDAKWFGYVDSAVWFGA